LSNLSGCRGGLLIGLGVSALGWALIIALAYAVGRLAGAW
jgi:hypothetical protein